MAHQSPSVPSTMHPCARFGKPTKLSFSTVIFSYGRYLVCPIAKLPPPGLRPVDDHGIVFAIVLHDSRAFMQSARLLVGRYDIHVHSACFHSRKVGLQLREMYCPRPVIYVDSSIVVKKKRRIMKMGQPGMHLPRSLWIGCGIDI